MSLNLTKSDAAVKQIIIDLDKSFHFILSDLDETHLFVGERLKLIIDGSLLERVRDKLDAILEENTYRIQD